MNGGIVTTGSSSQAGRSRESVRRIVALARAEGVLLRRNNIALLNAVVMPAVMVLVIKGLPGLRYLGGPGGPAALLLIGLTAFALVFPVYYNLVTALVARREGLVLKRLRTGEATDAEILAGTAAPAIVIAWVQIVVAAGVSVALFGLHPPVGAVLVPVALILGTAVFALLAVVSTAATRTVELAQVTTLPMLIPVAVSGLLFPLTVLREPLRWIAEALPLTPVVELLRLGLTGTAAGGHSLGLAATLGAATRPLLVLTAWILVAGWAARRWFRWEPRR